MTDEIEIPGADRTATEIVKQRSKPGPKSKAEKEALSLAPPETAGQPDKGRWVLSEGDDGLDEGWNWVGPAQEKE